MSNIKNELMKKTEKTRKIYITLTKSYEGYGYQINIGRKHACSGNFYKTDLDAYKAMVQQLFYNDDSFPINIEEPFRYRE